MEDPEKAENPEEPASEVCERVTEDAESSESQVSSSFPVENLMEKENNGEAGLPEAVEREVETTEVQNEKPSGSHETTLEKMTTQENLVEQEDSEKSIGNSGEKRSIESLEDSTPDEPVLKAPRLEISYGGGLSCNTGGNAETPKQDSISIIGFADSKSENLPAELKNDVSGMKSWDYDSIMQLIIAVKKRPALYDNGYIFGNAIWYIIAAELKRSKDDCRFMFASLREKFKITHMAMSDPKSDKSLLKDFPYYEEMLFLKPYIAYIQDLPGSNFYYQRDQRAKYIYKWPTLNCSSQSQTPNWLESSDESQNKPTNSNIFREKLLELEKERNAEKEAGKEKDKKELKLGDENEKPKEAQAEPETPKEPTESGDKISEDCASSDNVAKSQASEDFFSKLIKTIKDYPCIYDHKHYYFSHFQLKMKIWNTIAEKLNKSSVECLSTYKLLVQRFVETHARFQNIKFTWPGFPRVKFPYYDDMLFLEKHVNLDEVNYMCDSIISVVNKGNRDQNLRHPERIHPCNTRSQPKVDINARGRRRNKKNNRQNTQNHKWRRLQDRYLNHSLNQCDLDQGSSQSIYPRVPLARQWYQNWIQGIQDPELDSQRNQSKVDDVTVNENSDNAAESLNNLTTELPTEEDFNIKLIRVVKQYPCIYDGSNEDFVNEEINDQAWTAISVKLNLASGECSKLFKSLYEKFVKTYFMLHDPDLVKQGFSKENFKYYDEMIFLENQFNIAELQRDVKEIKEAQERESKRDKGEENQKQNLGNTAENTLKMKSSPFQFSQAVDNKDQNVLPSPKTDQPAAESHIDLFFKSFHQQVKSAGLTARDFVQLQIGMMTSLSNVLSQQRN